ncbi:MAG: hypothetical protein JO331_11955, partial [Verrucomicrobia bacterium]|nr:hypothetical protein [Verrucomicrobiota bacterium]
RAVETVLLVDHTKFGRRALSKVLDISQIHHVVTGEKATDVAVLSRFGIKVHVGTIEKAHAAAATI